jgi:nucleotide-binding universal stress UspA family protein
MGRTTHDRAARGEDVDGRTTAAASASEKVASEMRLLLATDGSVEATAACQFLQMLPLPHGSAIRVLCVADALQVWIPGEPFPAGTLQLLLEYEQDRAQSVVTEAIRMVAREGVVVTADVRTGAPTEQILRAADDFDTDLVVGSRGLTGLKRFLLGSVARGVANASRHPVLVARAPRNGIREVVVPIDGSENHSYNWGVANQAVARQVGYRARRWVVERTHSWLNRFRRLLIRWEKKGENYLGMLHLACAIITSRASGLLG